MVDVSEVCWIAGLLEGEGSFSLANKITPRIRLTMTDLDVMIKAATILGAHSVLAASRRTSTYKQVYYLTLHGTDAIDWMQRIYNLMGERRQHSIDICLAFWETKKTWTGRRRQFPKHGPRLSSPNVVWLNPSSPLNQVI